jgi:lysophospholipase L1-like esterase
MIRLLARSSIMGIPCFRALKSLRLQRTLILADHFGFCPLTAIMLLVALFSGCSAPGGATPSRSPDPDPASYLVSTNIIGSGIISPPVQDVLPGTQAEFSVSSDSGYRISNISGCGGSLNGNVYITGIINENCTVTVNFVHRSLPAEEFIFDNGGPDTLAKGKWAPSYAPYPIGSGSLASKEAGASYTFKAPVVGLYDLYLWWTPGPDRSAAVRVDIYDAAIRIDMVYVDQQYNGGRWNRLGSYYFSGSASIVIISPESQNTTCADAVRLVRIADEGPRVSITYPPVNHLQTSPDLVVMADALYLEKGWGIRFLLDAGARSIDLYLPPFKAEFKGIDPGEHTVEALIIDDHGMEVAGPDAYHQVNKIGIGGYYVAMGDSITLGLGDDFDGDDTSLDGRDRSSGYAPILNNFLAESKEFPHRIVNEGVAGARSVNGAVFIQALLAKHPGAQAFLVQYGTNDSYSSPAPIPSGLGLLPVDDGYHGSYKDYMQQIVDAVLEAGKEVYLARIPVALGQTSNGTPFPDPQTASRNKRIRDYNEVVLELAHANGITLSFPDFYAYFTEENPETGRFRYEEEFADNLHPNGLGYQSMARLWKESIANIPPAD